MRFKSSQKTAHKKTCITPTVLLQYAAVLKLCTFRTAFPEEDSNQIGNSFTAKLRKLLGDKTGKIQGGVMPCKAKILCFESLEERQLLAADSCFGGLSDLDRVSEFAIFPQPRS